MTSCSLSLINEGYKEISTLNTDGIDHPNWGIGTNKLLSETLTSSTTFKYYPLGTGVGATWGNRYTFCITRQTSNISNFYVIISSTQPLATSATLNGIMSATNFYYNSSNNNYYVNNVSIGIPALYVYPNINVDGGQVYFRIEPDKKIYSGYSKQTSSLIGTSNFTGQIYVGIVVQQTSGTGSGIYKMTSYTLFDPAPTINPNPFAGHSINTEFGGIGFKMGSYDTPTKTCTITGTLNSSSQNYTNGLYYLNNGANKFGFFIGGIDFYFKIKLTLNGNNIKVGIGGPNIFGFPPLLYNYDTLDGKCRIGNIVGTTIASGLTDLVFRFDKFSNFYVGDSTLNLTLVGNIFQNMDTITNIYSGYFIPASSFFFVYEATFGNVSNQIKIQNVEYGSDFTGFDYLYRYHLFENVVATQYYKLGNNSLSWTNTVSGWDRVPFSGASVYFGDNSGYSLSLQTTGIQSITNLYVSVDYNCNIDYSLVPLGVVNFASTGTHSFYYDCALNVVKRNGSTLSHTFTPTSSLLNLNGKLYVETFGNGNIYLGNSEATKVLITNNTTGFNSNTHTFHIKVWVQASGGKWAFKRLYPS